MNRASYREAIDWIARNDSGADPSALNPETVGDLVTSCLVADVFDVERIKVGRDIVRRRISIARDLERQP